MADFDLSAALESVRAARVIAVVRAPSPEVAVDACDALVRGGVTGLEITYSTPDAPRVIRELDERYGDSVLLGAGTVTSARDAERAAEAGARFLVSPGTRPALTQAMLATGTLVMTGALTPSELMEAVELGSHVVKIFPASLGGPAFLGALRAPFPDVPLMPTGGVTPDNVAAWFAAGAIAVGAGGDLVPGTALTNGDFDEIERRARLFSGKAAS
ncbi:2-keto-3-deoxy-phosphogluconate aldolase [Paramicrobacterium humi]|uniref:2-keto-3-deoxy-phosphogluconate aldolase n=1 Tax=Paramicrobacterium humi TaxID=640635 RepID=A0A1H4LZA1_9MICO|nr:bifunctional 4-hydroxy-2-oxoglutarate aldolase/2-dehydro-3-deoxy-phosphogluconate aldolase [Microbacterium humi]SEB75897.1 2-keto-3-deoxy-phosphogluconate aldolase [Microbacterium humi]